jgi:hypothetical protein
MCSKLLLLLLLCCQPMLQLLSLLPLCIVLPKLLLQVGMRPLGGASSFL